MSAKDFAQVEYENTELPEEEFKNSEDLSVRVYANRRPVSPFSSEQYSGVNMTSFKDFMLKDELYKAITECGFEHPSESMSPVSFDHLE